MADDDFLAPDIASSDLPEMWRRDPNFGLLLSGGQPGPIANYMATRGIEPPGEKEELSDWAGKLPSQGNILEPPSMKGDRMTSAGAQLAGGADRERALLTGLRTVAAGGGLGGGAPTGPATPSLRPSVPSPQDWRDPAAAGPYYTPPSPNASPPQPAPASPAPIPERTVQEPPEAGRPPVPLPPRKPGTSESSPDPAIARDQESAPGRGIGEEEGDQTRRVQDNQPHRDQRGINMGNVLAGVKAMAPPPPQHISTPSPYRPTQNVRTGNLATTIRNLAQEAMIQRQIRTLGEALRGR